MVHVKDFSIHGHKRIRKMLLAGSMTVFLFLYGIVGLDIPAFNNKTVEAQASSQELTGWAWSSNIGWISFNCINTDTCDDVDYKVLLNANKTLSGYAWSDNVGWLKFGGLSGFPSGEGTVSSNAKLNGENIEGWARFCAGTADGECGTMDNHPDGWDGWVSLGGTVTQGEYSSILNGYIWGSDVIGWIQWDPEFGGVEIGNPFDFSLSSLNGITLEKGESLTRTVEIERLSGEPATVTLNNPSVDNNLEISGLPDNCTPDDTCEISFVVKAKTSAVSGTYAVNLFAFSGSVTRNTSFNVTIPQDVTLSCSANPNPVKAGSPVDWTANVSPAGNYTYIWEENGDVLDGSSNTINRNYTSTGQKTMKVSIDGLDISATCSVQVDKKPKYDEF